MKNKTPYNLILILFFITNAIFGQKGNDTKSINDYRFGISLRSGVIGELKHQHVDGERTKIRGLFTALHGNFRLYKSLFFTIGGSAFESKFIENKIVDYQSRNIYGLIFETGLKCQITDFKNHVTILAEGGFSYIHAKISRPTPTNLYRLGSYDEPGRYVLAGMRYNFNNWKSIGVFGRYTNYKKTGSWFQFGLNANLKF